MRIDARVEGNTAEDLVVVDSEAVAQVGEFVCERDFRGEQRVRGVLDRFGRPQVGHEDGTSRGAIQGAEDAGRPRAVDPEDDPVRAQGVFEGAAFAQELRVHRDPKRNARGLEERPHDGLRRAREDRALHDDGTCLLVPPGGRHGLGRVVQRAHVHAPIRLRRGPDAEEDDTRSADRVLHSVDDREPLLSQGLLEPRLEPFLVEWRLSLCHLSPPILIDIEPDDSVPLARERHGRRQPDRAQSDDRDGRDGRHSAS